MGRLVALLNQSVGTPIGYLNPNLYQKVALAAGTFNDITSGNNGDYKAGPDGTPAVAGAVPMGRDSAGAVNRRDDWGVR